MMTKERFRALIIDAIKKQDDDKIEQFSELLFEQYEKGTDLDGKQRVTEMTLRELIIEMRKGFEAVDKRFEAVNKRFEAVDKRFEMLTHTMDKRFESVDKRFEELAHQMDKRFEMLTHQMDKRFESVDKRFEDMNKRFNFLTWFIAAGLVTTNILIALLKIF